MSMILFFLCGFMIGVIFCTFVYTLILSKKKSGFLRIDRSDPDGPLLFLELETDISSLSKKKQIVLKIKNEDFIPRKKQVL